MDDCNVYLDVSIEELWANDQSRLVAEWRRENLLPNEWHYLK